MTASRLLLAALGAIALAGCSQQPAQPKEGLVATVDGGGVSRNTFEQYVAGVVSIDHPLAALQAAVLGSLESLDGFYMWDELAAVLTVQPEVGTWTEKSIVVGDDGSTTESPEGATVKVATNADAASVRSLVLGALNELDS